MLLEDILLDLRGLWMLFEEARGGKVRLDCRFCCAAG